MIAMSATLKMPVLTEPMPTFRKSTTRPATTRSTRFESPPANSSQSPKRADASQMARKRGDNTPNQEHPGADREERRASPPGKPGSKTQKSAVILGVLKSERITKIGLAWPVHEMCRRHVLRYLIAADSRRDSSEQDQLRAPSRHLSYSLATLRTVGLCGRQLARIPEHQHCDPRETDHDRDALKPAGHAVKPGDAIRSDDGCHEESEHPDSARPRIDRPRSIAGRLESPGEDEAGTPRGRRIRTATRRDADLRATTAVGRCPGQVAPPADSRGPSRSRTLRRRSGRGLRRR